MWAIVKPRQRTYTMRNVPTTKYKQRYVRSQDQGGDLRPKELCGSHTCKWVLIYSVGRNTTLYGILRTRGDSKFNPIWTSKRKTKRLGKVLLGLWIRKEWKRITNLSSLNGLCGGRGLFYHFRMMMLHNKAMRLGYVHTCTQRPWE